MLKRCNKCNILFNKDDPVQAQAHHHPEPSRGLFQKAFLESKLSYVRWTQETREGQLWALNGGKAQVNNVTPADPHGYITLKARADELRKQYGSFPKASRAIGLSCSYLTRLHRGDRAAPSDKALEKLGLKKEMRTYYRKIKPKVHDSKKLNAMWKPITQPELNQ